jgi:hypothetical protein
MFYVEELQLWAAKTCVKELGFKLAILENISYSLPLKWEIQNCLFTGLVRRFGKSFNDFQERRIFKFNWLWKHALKVVLAATVSRVTEKNVEKLQSRLLGHHQFS